MRGVLKLWCSPKQTTLQYDHQKSKCDFRCLKLKFSYLSLGINGSIYT